MSTAKGVLMVGLGILAGFGILFAAGVIIVIMIANAAIDAGMSEGGAPSIACSERDKPLEKVWVCGEGKEKDPKVLRVKIDGIIADAPTDIFGREKASAMSALSKIRTATRDSEVKGLYLVIDSPGGEVTLSDIIADAVQRFKSAETNRFVLVEMGSLCCSGGYYIAAGADYIIAHPTTVTGSIGVIMSTINAAELAKKIGVESVVIATGTNKAMLDPLKPVEPAHVDILKKAVDADYERFLSIVAAGRKLPVDQVRKIADGRVLSAEEAKKLKLVDAIGYSEDAEAQLVKMAKADGIRIVRYKDEYSWKDLFSDSFISSRGMGKAIRSASTGDQPVKLNFLAQ